MIAITAITRLISLFSIIVIKIIERPIAICPDFKDNGKFKIIGSTTLIKPIEIIHDFETDLFFFRIIDIPFFLNLRV